MVSPNSVPGTRSQEGHAVEIVHFAINNRHPQEPHPRRHPLCHPLRIRRDRRLRRRLLPVYLGQLVLLLPVVCCHRVWIYVARRPSRRHLVQCQPLRLAMTESNSAYLLRPPTRCIHQQAQKDLRRTHLVSSCLRGNVVPWYKQGLYVQLIPHWNF